MALDTEAKRWSMLRHINGYSHVINPSGSDFDSQVERLTLLNVYGASLAPARTASVTIGEGPYTEDEVSNASGFYPIFVIWVTLTGDQYVNSVHEDNPLTAAFAAGFTADRNDPFGWNNQIRDNLTHSNVSSIGQNNVRFLDIGSASFRADYDTLADENITITVPSECTVSDSGDIVVRVPVSIIADAVGKGKKIKWLGTM